MIIPAINRFFQWFKVGLMTPILVLMMLSKGVALEQVGIVSAIMSICVIVFEVPSGVFSDRFGRRKIYFIALFFEAVSICIVFLGNSLSGVILGFGMYGVARAFSSGSIESLYIDHFINTRGKEALHRLITIMNISEAGGLAAGAMLGGLIPIFWKNSFPGLNLYNGNLVLQFIVIVFLFMLTLFTPYKDQQTDHVSMNTLLKESLDFLLNSRVIQLLLLGTFVWGFVFNGVEIFWQPRLKDIIDNESSTWIFGVVNSGYFMASILGSLVIGLILSKIKQLNYIIMAILRLCLGASIILLSMQNQLLGFTFFFILIMGFNGMLNVPEGTAINLNVPEDKRASLLSMSSFLMQMGGAIGAIIYSVLLLKLSVGGIWVIAGIVFALSSLIYVRLHFQTKM